MPSLAFSAVTLTLYLSEFCFVVFLFMVVVASFSLAEVFLFSTLNAKEEDVEVNLTSFSYLSSRGKKEKKRKKKKKEKEEKMPRKKRRKGKKKEVAQMQDGKRE